jgi:hypothetical protein
MPVTLVISSHINTLTVTLSLLVFVRNTGYLAHRHDNTGPLVYVLRKYIILVAWLMSVTLAPNKFMKFWSLSSLTYHWFPS